MPAMARDHGLVRIGDVGNGAVEAEREPLLRRLLHPVFGDANVIGKVPVLVKVCSKAFVPQLVKRALPGFELTHTPTPPPAVAIRPGTQYFLISRAGPCWEHIIKTREVGVYIPGEFPDAEPELLVAIDAKGRS